MTPADAVLVAQQCLRVGVPGEARVICELARESAPDDPALLVTHAAALAGCRQPREALALVDSVLARMPAYLPARHLHAHLCSAVGDRTGARGKIADLIETWPDYPGAQGALAQWLLPGPPYRDVLGKIHRLVRPDTYLEIGVETGASLSLATTATIAAGVDPVLSLIQYQLPPGAKTYATDSDTFFRDHSRAGVFGERPLDLAFIDGMHWFEFVLRDFVNVERWASPETVVLLHDCLPTSRSAAFRERASSFWVGDTWKVLDALLLHRPDLKIAIVPTPPSGLVVIRGLDPTSTVLSTRMTEIVAAFREAEYPHEPGRWPTSFGITENTDAGVARALGLP
jgi:hypothetical protein